MIQQVLLPMTMSALCHTACPNIRAEQTPFSTSRYITSRCSHNEVNVPHQIHVLAPLSGMESTGSAVKRGGIVLLRTLQTPCGHPPSLGVAEQPYCSSERCSCSGSYLVLPVQWFEVRNNATFMDLFEPKWNTDL